jgi:large subunit ribosomal protein L30
MKIRLVRSPIGASPMQRKNLKALGLKKLQQVVEKPESKTILGMVNKVKHMVEVQ